MKRWVGVGCLLVFFGAYLAHPFLDFVDSDSSLCVVCRMGAETPGISVTKTKLPKIRLIPLGDVFLVELEPSSQFQLFSLARSPPV